MNPVDLSHDAFEPVARHGLAHTAPDGEADLNGDVRPSLFARRPSVDQPHTPDGQRVDVPPVPVEERPDESLALQPHPPGKRVGIRRKTRGAGRRRHGRLLAAPRVRDTQVLTPLGPAAR